MQAVMHHFVGLSNSQQMKTLFSAVSRSFFYS